MVTEIRHIAIFVPDLREAEAYYQEIFDMQIVGRESMLSDGQWYSMPPDRGW